DMSCSVLDEEQFRQCCQLLLQRSDQLGDGWSWEHVKITESDILSSTVSALSQQDPVASTGSDFLRAEEEDDGSCTGTNSSSLVVQYEYHILFSCSYGAPVLYFRAFTLEGKSLALEEMWSTIHPNYRLRLQNCPLNAISQQEHPLLGQPFFFLHPCRTEEFMGLMLQAAQDQGRPVNYVLSWLSVVGPVVGLDVPLQYLSSCS
uniref:Ubiquitin-like-conjugating enzyme ATG10 n=1 Tax=Poecilia latipinna TaxID=48699 RepID=A0A3B3VE11_9TELE